MRYSAEMRLKMKVEKNGKIYCISEQVKSWVVACRQGAVETEYKVDKAICPTLDELVAYIKSEKLF